MLIENAFSHQEIKLMQAMADRIDVFGTCSYKNINKGISYNDPNSLFRRVIKPKIDRYIGDDHLAQVGVYKEHTAPGPLHFDTNYEFVVRDRKSVV